MSEFRKSKRKDPQEDIIALNRIISEHSFSNVHLLYGPEDYLRMQFRDKLVTEMGGVPGSLSYSRFTGKDIDVLEVLDLARTLPFMSDRRIILIENSGWFKIDSPEIEEYISSGMCEDTYIVFCEKEVDTRRKLFKLVKDNGRVSEFMTQTADTLTVWITSRMRENGIAISGSNARYFIQVSGQDMENLSLESEKLISYCLNKKRVDKEDIDLLTSRLVEDRIFDMCEEIAKHNYNAAVRMYQDLIALNASKPKGILIVMINHYNLLLKTKDLLVRNKYSAKEIGDAVSRQEWVIEKKIGPQCRYYKRSDLIRIIEMLTTLLTDSLNGLMGDEVLVETAIAKLSMMY